jgi:hypothetical protein
MYREKVQHFHPIIKWNGTEYVVHAVMVPMRKAPHVGADSPRYMDTGHPASVFQFHMEDKDGEPVVLGALFCHELREIRELIYQEWVVDQTAERLVEVVA